MGLPKVLSQATIPFMKIKQGEHNWWMWSRGFLLLYFAKSAVKAFTFLLG